ncbi:MAG: metal ABC transporter substrate-binding protein, partial [Candidatus Kapaibacteriota bacterium]
DPHLWTSPKTIYLILDTLAFILARNYPEKKDTFYLNAKRFKQKIDSINKVLDSLLTPIKNKPIFLFHPSLLYFIRDFDLLYGGAIEEIPGSEPTASHIANLINRVQTSGVRAIFSEPQLNPHTAEVIANHAKVKLYQLDPLGSENIKTYEDFVFSIARTIYEALK